MTRIKHVLILVILVLPMFALAPTLVASPNEISTNREETDSSLAVQYVDRTLRVAVYAEDNTTLPPYASGGISTAHHVNLIQFMDAQGYAVTALTTQDILDHKLMTADFDVFVLVNNLPKVEIIDYVKNYWLGGGSILSFDSGLGFLYYHGMIVPGDYGNYGFLGVDVTPHWGFGYVANISIQARHSTATNYYFNDVIENDEIISIQDFMYFDMANGPDFVPLMIDASAGMTTTGFALDNTMRQGGRIVQLPGNCSVIPNWQNSIIKDSIDWLAPRPKGRILFDLAHSSWLPIDAWNPFIDYYPMQNFRNGLVNHSYTVDKLHTEFTLTKLAQYDMLIVPLPEANFTSAEVEAVRTWVMNGGGLFVLGDVPHLGTIVSNCDYLISPYDISFNLTSEHTGFDATAVPPAELHPLHENALYLEIDDGSYLNITGDAYPLWFYNDDVVGAGQEYGEGRIIVSSDGNMPGDGLSILEQDNYQYLLNVANWLTAAKAKILVYADQSGDPRDPNLVPINGPVAQALNDFDLPFYITSNGYYMNKSLFSQDWDMVIVDNIDSGTTSYQIHLMDYVDSGGKLIFSTWNINSDITDYFGIDTVEHLVVMPPEVYLWADAHPMFNLPVPYGADNITSTYDLFGPGGTYALNFTTFPNATVYAKYSPTPDGGAGIILSGNGRAIINGPLITCYGEDTDDSTYPDNFEIWLNQIGWLYFDKPTINHPDDVTYMETETGNEITWLPVAPAGPGEYVVRENGSIIESGHWSGEAITINVDGVNASITTYQLKVFDWLGYSASDIVVLNVTAYVASTPTDPGGPGTPLDPTLLLIIAGVSVGVVVIIIIIVQLKKKK